MSLSLDNSAPLYYGAGISGSGTMLPFLKDDAGNVYQVSIGNGVNFHNIKTLAKTQLSQAGIRADATALGAPLASRVTWCLLPIAGKYFAAIGAGSVPGTGAQFWSATAYQINIDGSVTALGTRDYPVPGSSSAIIEPVFASTVRPDTREIEFVYSSFGGSGIVVGVIDALTDMIGGYVNRASAARWTGIAEITGSYSAASQPYLYGYYLSFVGSTLYVALNKAMMDWYAGHGSGIGWNSYYASLQAAHPNGVLLKIETTSTAGAIGHSFDGISSDFGWPFADEGLNQGGSLGIDNTDSYGPPVQQITTDGVVGDVAFARAYSDNAAQVGVRIFGDALTSGGGLQVFEVPGANYGASIAIGVPAIQAVGDFLYLAANSTGYALLGRLTEVAADPCIVLSGYVGADLPVLEDAVDATWPVDLQPRNAGLHAMFASLSGGPSSLGLEPVVANAKGFWRFSFEAIPVNTKPRILAFRQIAVQLAGRVGVCLVPLYDGKRAPQGADAIASGPINVGDTTANMQFNAGDPPRPGMHFSADERMYRLTTVGDVSSGDTYPVTFWPPARTLIDDGDALDFATPHCRMRLATDDQMKLTLQDLKFGSVNVDWVEDI